ncbi:MAG: toll/interleukin-1 receptor domain-containing protein [Geminicoccaceae bacterium]
MRAFISYSHQDEDLKDRLVVHLAQMQRDGLIDTWHDRKILAGGKFADEIDIELDRFDLFIPLVSPDFIYSRYCYDIEMSRAIERSSNSDVYIVPIILEPSDWHSTPLGQFNALPRDGKPVSEWTNKNTALHEVVRSLRELVSTSDFATSSNNQHRNKAIQTSKKYRLKRDFDHVDKEDFKNESYALIHRYFQDAVEEIDTIDNISSRMTDISPFSFTCTIINRSWQRGIAHITVHKSTGNTGFGDIYYSNSENASEGAANGMFSISHNEHDMFFSPDMLRHGGSKDGQLSARDVAEQLWNELLENAGIVDG